MIPKSFANLPCRFILIVPPRISFFSSADLMYLEWTFLLGFLLFTISMPSIKVVFPLTISPSSLNHLLLLCFRLMYL